MTFKSLRPMIGHGNLKQSNAYQSYGLTDNHTLHWLNATEGNLASLANPFASKDQTNKKIDVFMGM
jgi:hypothetical protein